MSGTDHRQARRPPPDALLSDIARYVLTYHCRENSALETARYCLLDSLSCLYAALEVAACRRRLGAVAGFQSPGGCHVPGTQLQLDPVQAAFNIGTMIRWLDFNDTWLAAEWGHPSDNLGGILACAEIADRKQALSLHDILQAMIQAYEIQGVLALNHAFNRVGLDHVILVKIATTAVTTRMLGGNEEQIINALSNAWLDGGALRTYRHAPNTGPRKSWAAGDATARGLWHAWMAINGELGYPAAMSTPRWGFCDVLFEGKAISLQRPLGCYVMENILFKISYPAEFHAQTALEAAISLYPRVKDRIPEIDRIEIQTQKAAATIIDKTGPLHNPADRDHCIQYITAIGLIHGTLTAEHYEDHEAADPRIDELRDKMTVVENPAYTQSYYDENKRAIGNAVVVHFKNGDKLMQEQLYPVGHRSRRREAVPLLLKKFQDHGKNSLDADRRKRLLELLSSSDQTNAVSFADFLALL